MEPEEDEIDNSLKLAKHIFGEQWQMCLDYIQLLYQNPMQKLPILCLFSEEYIQGMNQKPKGEKQGEIALRY